jgi:hypothetical protein
MQNGDTKGFHQQFGDTFVQGIKIGGVYYAVLEFISKDTTEHKEIGASLDFRYLTFNGSAELKSKLDEVTKNTKL